MLDRQFKARHLETVDWDTLKTCQTSATNVGPFVDLKSALEDLFSGDWRVSRQAHGRLENNIVVQGYLYEAAGYVATVICAAIREDWSNATDDALDLLFELAAGHEETGTIEARCRMEVVALKEQLLTIASWTHGKGPEIAFDILAHLADEDDKIQKFLRDGFEAGKLSGFRHRLQEDGIIPR